MRITYNAPVSLTFFLLAMFVFYLDQQVVSGVIQLAFTVSGKGGFNFKNLDDYFRLVSYVLGHRNWGHLINNLMFILLLGPSLEEKVGSLRVFFMILVTAFLGGFVNVMFFSTLLIGCSGIVFMMIVFSSFANIKQRGEIPLSFFLVIGLYFWKEVSSMVFVRGVSQISHIIGGLCGGFFGFTQFVVCKKNFLNPSS